VNVLVGKGALAHAAVNKLRAVKNTTPSARWPAGRRGREETPDGEGVGGQPSKMMRLRSPQLEGAGGAPSGGPETPAPGMAGLGPSSAAARAGAVGAAPGGALLPGGADAVFSPMPDLGRPAGGAGVGGLGRISAVPGPETVRADRLAKKCLEELLEDAQDGDDADRSPALSGLDDVIIARLEQW